LANSTLTSSIRARARFRGGRSWIDGWVKLTVDGSFKMVEDTVGCGMVLRGADRNIIVSSCHFLPRCVEVVEAELWACKEGLELALNIVRYLS
jgi:hypothetical protein